MESLYEIVEDEILCLRIIIRKYRNASVRVGSSNRKITKIGNSTGEAKNGSLTGPDRGAAKMKDAASIDSAAFPYLSLYIPDGTTLSLMTLLITNMYQSDLIPPLCYSYRGG